MFLVNLFFSLFMQQFICEELVCLVLLMASHVESYFHMAEQVAE